MKYKPVEPDVESIKSISKRYRKAMMEAIKYHKIIEDLVPLIFQVSKAWSNKNWYKNTWSRKSSMWAGESSITLQCYLAKNDSLNSIIDVLEMIESMLKDYNFEFNSTYNNVSGSSRDFKGHIKGVDIRVEVYFSNSESCRLVETGEKIVTMKKIIVCD